MALKVPLSYCPIDSEAIKNVLNQYAGLSHGDLISDFETKLGVFANTKHVVALNSGTAAIHMALKAVGVSANDEVLVPAFTYVATVNPILYLGAKPIFIDVEEHSWNMDTDLLEVAITDSMKNGGKPKAILVVHNYGMPANMERIMNISHRYEIPVVEDAAEAIGSRIGNKLVGTFGKIGILSFNNNKILTTYGGGAILTEDQDLAAKILFWSGQSRENKRYYEHKELGFNYRMGPVNAAIGLSKMDTLEVEIDQRRKAFELYRRFLTGKSFQFQEESVGHVSNRWLSTVSFVAHQDIDGLVQYMENQGIETRRVWNPINRQPFYSSFRYVTEQNISDGLFSKSICLPFCLSKIESTAGAILRGLGDK